ncbi:MAG TPA: hypothetical protein VNS62_01185, partial [Candidatus Udaeobacter sp.]|nr:hypothetical protein [Candidatus Udaeobacter sp.]
RDGRLVRPAARKFRAAWSPGNLFSVSRNVLGGWFPVMLQQLTMLLVLWATYRNRQHRIAQRASS